MLGQIIERLNGLAAAVEHAPLERESIWFVLDTDVHYGQEISVDAAKLMTWRECDEFLGEHAAGASWVHASLTHTSDGHPLVTINVGRDVGNPEPALNVSVERNGRVRVVGDQRPAGPADS
jgi:hypothetical protein